MNTFEKVLGPLPTSNADRNFKFWMLFFRLPSIENLIIKIRKICKKNTVIQQPFLENKDILEKYNINILQSRYFLRNCELPDN